MEDDVIRYEEIYLQDIVCDAVAKSPRADDFLIYNAIATRVDIPSMDITERILALIKLNKTALLN